MKAPDAAPDVSDVFATAPQEWGRWGEDDEIGRANLLDEALVVATAATCIRTGKRFSLALPLGHPDGDPVLPGREPARLTMDADESFYRDGRLQPLAGGARFAADTISVSCHGTTHMDALGHAFVQGQLWNGYSADTTVGGLTKAGIGALAAKGVVGRGVLVDIARAAGVDHLPMGHLVTVSDLVDTLAAQSTELARGDILIVRTGIFNVFYDEGPERFYEGFDEPGLSYEPALLDLLNTHDISALGTDTLCNERQHCADLGAGFPLHVLLQRNLGISFHEGLWLEDWAADCAHDEVWEALYIAAPLRIVRGTAAPMNPIVIK